ncbi:transcriptional repressor [Muricauda sp. 334s03]|uniref:Transcriptional repressor n=1 Tax=Flagellimonas yonaguniensis TaxID=3031325 RepID=A0ABT5Y208_9FLAO|nr:transcriptional repressor [[Muricauda] yonaguniensis]MDF0717482.1 transcriptional repressor [[Muricauda] yonaguniensis]
MKRRNTPSKQAVLDVLIQSGQAMSHDAIEGQLEMDINRATIYRILNQFCEDGMVHTIVANDGKHYFALCNNSEIAPSGFHFHFSCTKCKTISCLDQEVQLNLPPGFVMEKANCVVTGTCQNCV